MSSTPDSTDHTAALRVLHLHEYYVQHPNVGFPDLAGDGRFLPAKARRSAAATPDEFYRCPMPAPADDLLVDVVLAGSSEWECGDRYTRAKSRGFAIELVTQGQGELRIGRQKCVVLKPGDVFILHPGERHTYRACSRVPFKKLFVALSVDTPMQRETLALTPLWQCSHLRLPPATARQVREIMEQIVAVLRAAGDDAPLRASLAAYELLVVLLRAARQQPGATQLDPRVEAVMSFVINHISNPLSIRDLARVAAVSPDHLNRLFAKAVGMRAHQWLINLRMRFAAELLVKTRAPVQTIAAQAGYDNPYAFSRAFKQVAGMTPMAYRTRAWHGR